MRDSVGMCLCRPEESMASIDGITGVQMHNVGTGLKPGSSGRG